MSDTPNSLINTITVGTTIVVCQNANVIGIIDGNLSVKEFLTLYATSRVRGDIVANKLAIESGAYFTGSCHMLDELTD